MLISMKRFLGIAPIVVTVVLLVMVVTVVPEPQNEVK